ncbi:hypothetical protein FA15DRAFT_751381 [Coprinopsis marcescibilis]|uniref:WD40 repeat-like protein n=1 Tax=Coprinopsis marcescibilis TaxID=230819 RepID=A0A5C3LNM8_COPMA|nr:hypothetical protein FA15DRAFT_751381 [Coprinopsis marcescibilis]
MSASNQDPWFRNLRLEPPFRLSKRISSTQSSANFRSVACFPWNKRSIETFWPGNLAEQHASPWAKIVDKYWDAVAVGAEDCQPLEPLIEADKICLAWTVVHSAPTQPLLVFSRGSLLYIYSFEQAGIAGYLRGHGGAITSIEVHPTRKFLVCTTSRDHSARIYDLAQTPALGPSNPHWPPMPKGTMSLAGPAHGLHMNQPEGSGIGRCITVLMGGRSGGHNGAVLGAAFHRHLPLIATCGMDRTVKIWAIRANRKETEEHIIREDKPLFSTGRIHKARVLSVAWLQDDVLVSHSAAAFMRKEPGSNKRKETYFEPGQMAVWRWLGMNRFFPPGFEDKQRDMPLRGCVSDYQDSSSFKIITVYAYDSVQDQLIVPQVSVFQSPTLDPLLFSTIPGAREFLITNIAILEPRKMPSFAEAFPHLVREMEAGGSGLETVTERLRIGGNELGDSDAEDEPLPPAIKIPSHTFEPATLRQASWPVLLRDDDKATLNCTCMAFGGRCIVGVGSKGTLWVWTLKQGV